MTRTLLILAALFLANVTYAQESETNELHTFRAGEAAVAVEVNENFILLLNKINELESRLSAYEAENLGPNDPLIGTWSCIQSYNSGQVNNPVNQIFFESGSMNDAIFSCWVSGWERQSDQIIIHRTNCSDQIFTPQFNNDNTILNFSTSDWQAACTKVE